MFLLSLNTLIGAAIGAVVVVVSPKAFAFVKKQFGWGKAKAEALAATEAGKAVAAGISAVKNDLK